MQISGIPFKSYGTVKSPWVENFRRRQPPH